MARRIGGRGGGSSKGSGGAVTALLAVGVAVALGVGGTSAAGSGLLGPGGSASVSGRGSSKVGNQDSAAAEARIVARGVRVTARVTDDASNCAAHAYGQVRDFLTANPCVGLHRALFEVRDRKGEVVLVAASWVEMADVATARRLKQLVDASGSGNVVELSREQGRYEAVRYTGDFYASRLNGAVVSNAQAQPVARGKTGLALTVVVNDALA